METARDSDRHRLKTQAEAVLAANDSGGWTRPAPGLYPHQWLWDSCFVAIGLAHTNPERAATELRSLVRGQWSDGMLPHMIYTRQWPRRLDALFWGATPLAPRGVKTSGITQPPLLAVAVERVAAALSPSAGRDFTMEMLPVLVRYHDWIYHERDPHGTGLAACLHSWESGLDDTPYWTQVMDRLPPLPLYLRWVGRFPRARSDERASPANVQHMLALVRILRAHHYRSRELIAQSPVVIDDPVFNSVLAAANESLERLAESVARPLPAPLHDRFAVTRRALEQLWDPGARQYFARDRRTGELIAAPTAAAFCGHGQPRARRRAPRSAREHRLPNAPPAAVGANYQSTVEPQRYWRGPVWLNLNWFTIRGLERYGYMAEAAALRHQTLELVVRAGFREYYQPFTGDGLGGSDFSWSAALTIDLLS